LVAPSRLAQFGPPLVAVAIAALWPLSAYTISPAALPAALVLAILVAVVVWRPEWGIAVLLAIAPFFHQAIGLPGPAAVFPARPFAVLLPALSGFVLLYGILVSNGRWQSVEARRLLVAVLIFVAVLFLSTAHALDPSASISKVSLILTAVFLFLAVIQICERRSQLMVVVTGALIGLLAASVQGVVQHFTGAFGGGFEAGGVGGFDVGRVQGSFDTANQFAGYIASLLPLAAVILLSRDFSKPLRALSLAAVALAIPALVFSYARGSIVAAVLGAIVWLAFLRPRTAVAIAAIVIVSAILLAPGTLKERFNPQATHADFIERVDLWNAAIQMYEDHPFLGVGVNNYQVAYPNLPKTPSVAPEHRQLIGEDVLIPPHAHNLYLNVLAEEGILGAFALLGLLVTAISAVYRGCRVSDPLGRTVCIGIGVGLMTLLANSFVEVTLFTEAAIPLFGLLGVATVFVGLEPSRAKFPELEISGRSELSPA
jgi:O-antigen ligase